MRNCWARPSGLNASATSRLCHQGVPSKGQEEGGSGGGVWSQARGFSAVQDGKKAASPHRKAPGGGTPTSFAGPVPTERTRAPLGFWLARVKSDHPVGFRPQSLRLS